MRLAWSALAVGGVMCYVVQLMLTVNIRVEGRPGRGQEHEADQDNETVVVDEEGNGDEGVQDGDE
jgi:sorting and assembly machinery component 37